MDLVKTVALSCLNLPYIWGGSTPLTGMDCSGFVQWVLASCGMDPPGDQTAQGLFDHFSKNGQWNKLGCGSIAFYGKSATQVTHVAIMLDAYRIIEAGGGDSSCVDYESAKKKNAMIRVRLLKNRGDLVAVIRPNYVPIGIT